MTIKEQNKLNNYAEYIIGDEDNIDRLALSNIKKLKNKSNIDDELLVETVKNIFKKISRFSSKKTEGVAYRIINEISELFNILHRQLSPISILNQISKEKTSFL